MGTFPDDLPFCHIYAQWIWHADAQIEGTKEALTKIRDAIDIALATGRETQSDSLFTTDGEGYSVTVSIANQDYLSERGLPYTAHFAGGVGAKEVDDWQREQRETKKAIRAWKRAGAAPPS